MDKTMDKRTGVPVEVTFSSEHRPDDHAWVKEDLSGDVPYKLSRQADLKLTADGAAVGRVLHVDPTTVYQKMRGIGISMEGTTVMNLWALTKEARMAVLREWFDPQHGCGYNWVRLCCGTSDFSGVDWYTYDDVPGDIELKHFSIEKDQQLHIPEICREILSINPALTFLMSPWSPPAWTKDNNDMTHGGHILPQYYGVVAELYARAVEAYRAEGVLITEFTTNNETRYGPDTYPGCLFTVDEEVAFAECLRATFDKHGLHYVKVLALDHNPELYEQAIEALQKTDAIDATAFHDYVGPLSNMSLVHDAFPHREIYFTERAVWGTAGANRIIQYMRNYCNSYMSWVSICDSNQMPNNSPYQGMGFGTTLAFREAGSDSKFWFTPETYLIGQFSRFIPYGSHRIESDYGDEQGVSTLAVKAYGGDIVILAVNNGEQDEMVTFDVKGEGRFTATIPGKTMATYTCRTGK